MSMAARHRKEYRALTAEPINQSGLRAEVTTFLRNMYELNISIVQRLSPMLEAQQGIDMRLYFILHIISDQCIVFPSAIAQAIRLPNSLVTKHLDQLAQKGLLERSMDPEDSRRIRVKVTAKGVETMHGADLILAEQVGQRLSRVSDRRRADFLATLVDLAHEPDQR